MDVEEEFAALLAAGVEQVLADVLLQAAIEDAVGGSGKELMRTTGRSTSDGGLNRAPDNGMCRSLQTAAS